GRPCGRRGPSRRRACVRLRFRLLSGWRCSLVGSCGCGLAVLAQPLLVLPLVGVIGVASWRQGALIALDRLQRRDELLGRRPAVAGLREGDERAAEAWPVEGFVEGRAGLDGLAPGLRGAGDDVSGGGPVQ